MSWKRRKRLYMARLGLVLATVSLIGFVWFTASWIDVNANSLNNPQNEGNWNLFKISQTIK